MNAERLHVLCRVIKQQMDSQNSTTVLTQVAKCLEKVMNQQGQNFQANLGAAVKRLYESLADSTTDSFSPAWMQALDEIGGTNLVGRNLADQVQRILERNEITPSIAHDEVGGLSQALETFRNAVNNVVSGLHSLHIGAEEMAPGECEIGVLIPRQAIDTTIAGFGKELQGLDFIFKTFSEVASGKHEPFQIKTLSSSDFMIYLAAVPSVAACIAHAAEKIINVYKSMLEIKKLKGEIEKQGVTEEQTKGIADHATSMMGDCIQELKIEIVNEYYKGKDGPRKNELTNAVGISLNRLANRIDKGFNIEVRVEPYPAEEGEDGEEEQGNVESPDKKYVDRIFAAAEALRFMKLEGGRLLQLSEDIEKPKTKARKN